MENQQWSRLKHELSRTDSSYSGVKTPMTCHPALSHVADFVRSYDQDTVRVMGVLSHCDLMCEVDEVGPDIARPIRTSILTRTRYVAPMPFVGDALEESYMYEWSVWVDEYSRHISGPSKIRYDFWG